MYKKKTQGAGYALARSKKTMIPVVWWAAMERKRRPRGLWSPPFWQSRATVALLFLVTKRKKTFMQHMKPFRSRHRRLHISLIFLDWSAKKFAKLFESFAFATRSKFPICPPSFECYPKLFGWSWTLTFHPYFHRKWQEAVGWEDNQKIGYIDAAVNPKQLSSNFTRCFNP